MEVFDPWVDSAAAKREYGIDLVSTLEKGTYNGIIIAVAHHQFTAMSLSDIRGYCCDNSVIYDIKNIFPCDQVDGSL